MGKYRYYDHTFKFDISASKLLILLLRLLSAYIL